MTLIDTSTWIDALREKGPERSRDQVADLIRSGEAAWCPVIRLELWAGIGDARERKVLSGFGDVVVELPVTGEVWELAIDLAGLGRTTGFSFPIPDLVVFACGRIHGAKLLHCDKHFDQLEDISPS
jgi:predicted nucleic acid-binding protein